MTELRDTAATYARMVGDERGFTAADVIAIALAADRRATVQFIRRHQHLTVDELATVIEDALVQSAAPHLN